MKFVKSHRQINPVYWRRRADERSGDPPQGATRSHLRWKLKQKTAKRPRRVIALDFCMSSRPDLRSSGTRRLVQLGPTCTSFHRRRRAFPVAGPQLWNTLPFGGDVGAVAGDLPQATEDLLVHAVITGHPHALTVFYCVTDLLFYLLYAGGPCRPLG